MTDITKAQPPSYDPAELDTLTGAFNFILKKALQNTDDMLPAKVVAYDRATNRAIVQPMIKILTTGSEVLSRSPLASVPVLNIGGGGFLINFPITTGSLGWIKASDRDISLYLQSGRTESPPNTVRLHSFRDGIFIPDIDDDYTIAGEDAANMVIQNTAGTVRISLWASKVKITAPTVEISATTITSAGVLTHAGAVNITGALAVTGAMTNAGVSVGSTHKHSGVTAGAGNTGNPI